MSTPVTRQTLETYVSNSHPSRFSHRVAKSVLSSLDAIDGEILRYEVAEQGRTGLSPEAWGHLEGLRAAKELMLNEQPGS